MEEAAKILHGFLHGTVRIRKSCAVDIEYGQTAGSTSTSGTSPAAGVCLKIVFGKLCVTLCGRFKWDVQIVGMNFQTHSWKHGTIQKSKD